MGLRHLHLGHPVFLVVEPGLAWPAAVRASGQAHQQPDPWPAATSRRATPGAVRGSAVHGASPPGQVRQTGVLAAAARLAASASPSTPRDAHPILPRGASSPTQPRYPHREVTLPIVGYNSL